MAYMQRKLTLQEMLDYLQEISSEDGECETYKFEALVIEPPENDGDVSGEDDVDDLEVSGLPDDLCAGQLRAGCELILSNGDHIVSFAEDIIEDLDESSASGPRVKTLNRSETQTSSADTVSPTIPYLSTIFPIPLSGLNDDYTWLVDSSYPLVPIFPEPNYEDLKNLKPHQQFEKFFDDNVLSNITECTNMYAVHNNRNIDPVTNDELRIVIGILLVGGYIGQNSFRNLWNNDNDLRNEMVYNSMRRNRFENIIWNLHFEKNLRSPPVVIDKMWKLRPLTDQIKSNMIRNFHPEQNLSYDESMVPYFGRHGCKQFIKGKPMRFGYKVWSLCTPSGYMINFEVYQGQNPRSNDTYQKNLGKCAAPLVSMIDDFPEDLRNMPYSFFFDNLFTGVPLLMYLKTRGYNGTGTIRENRIPKKCPIPKKDELKKKCRGHIESIKMKESDIHLTKWVDNSVVCLASTAFGKLPISNTNRYSRQARKKISVTRPAVVAEYNKYMCGVDRFDQNVAAYRIAYRGKKWWFPIFTWLIDACVQNAWQLHRKVHPSMTQFQFRREIAVYYCKHYGKKPKSTGPTTSNKRKASDVLENTLRYDRVDHLVVPIQNKRRCAGDCCKSIIRTKCEKCDVGLCLQCFKPYHTLDS